MALCCGIKGGAYMYFYDGQIICSCGHMIDNKEGTVDIHNICSSLEKYPRIDQIPKDPFKINGKPMGVIPPEPLFNAILTIMKSDPKDWRCTHLIWEEFELP